MQNLGHARLSLVGDSWGSTNERYLKSGALTADYRRPSAQAGFVLLCALLGGDVVELAALVDEEDAFVRRNAFGDVRLATLLVPI